MLLSYQGYTADFVVCVVENIFNDKSVFIDADRSGFSVDGSVPGAEFFGVVDKFTPAVEDHELEIFFYDAESFEEEGVIVAVVVWGEGIGDEDSYYRIYDDCC